MVGEPILGSGALTRTQAQGAPEEALLCRLWLLRMRVSNTFVRTTGGVVSVISSALTFVLAMGRAGALINALL